MISYEQEFQRMLIKNMDEVIKVFFRGSSLIKLKSNSDDKHRGSQRIMSLKELNRAGIVQSRVRDDTKVKQYHAGQLFEYLRQNIKIAPS